MSSNTLFDKIMAGVQKDLTEGEFADATRTNSIVSVVAQLSAMDENEREDSLAQIISKLLVFLVRGKPKNRGE